MRYVVRLLLTRQGVDAPEEHTVEASDELEALGKAVDAIEGRDWLLPPKAWSITPLNPSGRLSNDR